MPHKRSDYRREENDAMHAGPPLDLSFKNASAIDDLATQTVQSSRVGRLPQRSRNGRFITSSLWLSNNSLPSTTRLGDLTLRFLERPAELRWLDLAYNRLHTVDDEVLGYERLTILYLHGNDIADMRSIVKLRTLKKLRSLTLHGNPIERMPSYRRYVLAILPQLTCLDFSPIIDAERRRALPVGFHKTIQVDL